MNQALDDEDLTRTRTSTFCVWWFDGGARVVFGGFDGGPVALMGLGERGSLQIFFLQFAIVFNSHCGLLFYFFCNFFMFFLISAFKNVR